ncbi:MAG TPA: UDP-N-acetylmuramoyl-tripeptide--D-alanyl-D-alanine ligase [bacterium]|nr:UDP-N-acetylmuramoyl-tripeptide--D-alanyl-D-alanine ligase [bacterium]
MWPLTVAEIARITAGIIIAGNDNTQVNGISTDSRTLKEEDLFVALPGERTDGHKFVPMVLSQAAAAALVTRPVDCICPPGKSIILVADTSQALLELGAWYRRQFLVRTVAITGSTGKTTTKDLIAKVLMKRWRTLKSPGNLNTEIGLPLTLFNLGQDHEMAVLELAMRGPGQIRQLAEVARPEVGVITNIGVAHLGVLGTRANIARAKGELLEILPAQGIAVLNGDDLYLRRQSSRCRCSVIYFGLKGDADMRGFDISREGMAGISFTVDGLCGRGRVQLPLIGKFNVSNALAAIAVGHYFGLSLAEMTAALKEVRPPAMRLNIIKRPDGALIIDDAYNANPVSMRGALGAMSDLAQGRRTVAVLGDMLELGALAPAAHKEVGRLVGEQGVDCLIAVGFWASNVVEGAIGAGFDVKKTHICPDAEAAANVALSQVRPRDVVLVKASRGLQFEHIVAILKQEGCR